MGHCPETEIENHNGNLFKGDPDGRGRRKMAVQAGADGILISNHGGRQLDGAMTTLDALPEIVDEVKGGIPVHIGDGTRRGSDIFKALAQGVGHCWVGRVPLWRLAYNGEDGVSLALNILLTVFGWSRRSWVVYRKDIRPQRLARLVTEGRLRRSL